MSLNNSTNTFRAAIAAGLFAALAGSGCVQNMSDQPRYEPLEASTLFEDGRASRPLVVGTVARGQLRVDEAFFTGKQNGTLLTALPERALAGRDAKAVLDRGRERFEIFCAVCHGRVGHGDGMVVRSGFPQPPSYHIDRLREAPPGHFFDVVTNGSGRMPSYAAQVPPADRWAIAAYIQALQLSQHAIVSDLPSEDRDALLNIEN
jgi:mono/diheme cytochrome c family protein